MEDMKLESRIKHPSLLMSGAEPAPQSTQPTTNAPVTSALSQSAPRDPRPAAWHEAYSGTSSSDLPSPQYRPLLDRLQGMEQREVIALQHRLDATLREMGVTFNADKDHPHRKPWSCDLLPHIFTPEEWRLLSEGFTQRIRAFEMFLQDVYGKKEILRSRTVPIHPVLGSPRFLHEAAGFRPTDEAFIHLASMCVTRDRQGRFVAKDHRFSRASGISYMIQNRRVLARVAPQFFEELSVAAVAETPLAILERMRELSNHPSADLTSVLLTGGANGPDAAEASFLARRMGMQIGKGGDLIVLDDKVYLKVLEGLEQVEVIYNLLPSHQIDPLVGQPDSKLGVPGLIHCMRRGEVAFINGAGAELADDRSLLCFASQIIRFYLGERPILPTLPTYWLGDIDQREMVLEDLPSYRIRALHGEAVLGGPSGILSSEAELRRMRKQILQSPGSYVAQSLEEGGLGICVDGSKLSSRPQDHLLFALRRSNGYQVFPGALTRVARRGSLLPAFEWGGGSKDTWVLTNEGQPSVYQASPRRTLDQFRPQRRVTSRLAEGFYWLGRYLERICSLTSMIQVIEAIELEELNSSERKLYRPIWGQLLPPLEDKRSRGRSIGSQRDRLLLILEPTEPDSAVSLLRRAILNAESVLESLSPEAWGILSEMRDEFARARMPDESNLPEMARQTRKLSDAAARLIPQFFGVAESTMLADEGWRIAEFGRYFERATITGNAVLSIATALAEQLVRPLHSEHATEIELSAFLRLLATRDAYRRIYQMRAEPALVLEMLWQNPEAPKSVPYSLKHCERILEEHSLRHARGTSAALKAVRELSQRLAVMNWPRITEQVPRPSANPGILGKAKPPVPPVLDMLESLQDQLLDIHHVISDGFLNHQAHIPDPEQKRLPGFADVRIRA